MADDGTHGKELWKSDGSPEGTVLVKDITPGEVGSAFGFGGVVAGDRLYFAAGSTPGNQELWTTDGTDVGTILVKDINPGTAGSDPHSLTNVGGAVYFAADDGTHGNELWRSDGTEAGTNMVKNLAPGAASSFNVEITPLGNEAAFSTMCGESPSYAYSLWVTDGTEAGTILLKDMAEDYRLEMLAVNGELFFCPSQLDGQLWVSDGTQHGTHLLKNLYPGANDTYLGCFTEIAGKLYFTAGAFGDELWISDGSEAGTYLIREICPDPEFGSIDSITEFHGTALLEAADLLHGSELWISDGTAPGTSILMDVVPGPEGSWPFDFVCYQDTGLFWASDGVHGFELWRLPSYPFAFKNTFNFRTSVSISMTFFHDVSASLSAGDLVVVNTDTNEAIDPAAMAVSFDAATKTATFTFPGLPDGMLPDGNYRATLPADAVTDPQGLPLSQDEVLDFWYLCADPNRDGTVNLADFNILAKYFGQSDRDFTQGDFNYDGQVTIADFDILAARFGMALPAAGRSSLGGTASAFGSRVINQVDALSETQEVLA